MKNLLLILAGALFLFASCAEDENMAPDKQLKNTYVSGDAGKTYVSKMQGKVYPDGPVSTSFTGDAYTTVRFADGQTAKLYVGQTNPQAIMRQLIGLSYTFSDEDGTYSIEFTSANSITVSIDFTDPAEQDVHGTIYWELEGNHLTLSANVNGEEFSETIHIDPEDLALFDPIDIEDMDDLPEGGPWDEFDGDIWNDGDDANDDGDNPYNPDDSDSPDDTPVDPDNDPYNPDNNDGNTGTLTEKLVDGYWYYTSSDYSVSYSFSFYQGGEGSYTHYDTETSEYGQMEWELNESTGAISIVSSADGSTIATGTFAGTYLHLTINGSSITIT